MDGRILALGTAASAGAPIEPRAFVDLRPGVGVVGDRYAEGTGYWMDYPDREVTLVEAEAADELGVAPLSLRRNIVTRGVDLESLFGRSFTAGGATLEGIRACAPCAYLGKLLAQPDLVTRLRGGLRARVIAGGMVRVGDAVRDAEP